MQRVCSCCVYSNQWCQYQFSGVVAFFLFLSLSFSFFLALFLLWFWFLPHYHHSNSKMIYLYQCGWLFFFDFLLLSLSIAPFLSLSLSLSLLSLSWSWFLFFDFEFSLTPFCSHLLAFVFNCRLALLWERQIHWFSHVFCISSAVIQPRLLLRIGFQSPPTWLPAAHFEIDEYRPTKSGQRDNTTKDARVNLRRSIESLSDWLEAPDPVSFHMRRQL